MPAVTPGEDLRLRCREAGELLNLPYSHQLFVRVTQDERLRSLGRYLRGQGYHLVTLIGTDERELVDKCFKLTYLFAHPTEDLFLFIEHPVVQSAGSDGSYASLYEDFKAVDPFERELADMFGLYPFEERPPRRVTAGSWLHEECYPPELDPLRRDRTAALICAAVEGYHFQAREVERRRPPDGEWLVPVGPIHAGVIEPGRFLFRLSGEGVEAVDIRLGYTHKGVERLFQADCQLADGWRLAEQIAGDSIFAHSLAYCQAAEALAGVRPPREAELLRGLFLELERMTNHIGDCAALAHDVVADLAAAELAALRERLLQLNHRQADQRLLRDLNRPGGILLKRPLNSAEARPAVAAVAGQFAGLAEYLANTPAVRDRLQWAGILTEQQARELGATGLVARASGILCDFRVQHPAGIYGDLTIQRHVEDGLPGVLLLYARDLKDPSRFAAKLRDAQAAPYRYLREKLSHATRRLVDVAGGSRPPAEALARALVRDLNEVLQGACLYDESDFKAALHAEEARRAAKSRSKVVLEKEAVLITEEIRSLIARRPQGRDLLRLNRMLLEAVCPEAIARNAYDSITTREATAGDALARFLARMREVASSARIIDYILEQPELRSERTEFVERIEFQRVPNFEFGLGYVEGWRGDIVYWLMKDKFERIYRCKVRDPSLINWPALKAAIDAHDLDDEYVRRYKPPRQRAETIIADFPLINKSFNLSYSGNDL